MAGFGKAIAVSVVSSVCGGAAWLALEPNARQFIGLEQPTVVTEVAPPAPVTPPPTITATPSFDCTRAASAIERLICSDDWLAESDQLLNRSWTRLQEADRADDEAVEAQRAWIQRRNACVLEDEAQACVRTAYRERIRELDALVAAPAAAPDPTTPAAP